MTNKLNEQIKAYAPILEQLGVGSDRRKAFVAEYIDNHKAYINALKSSSTDMLSEGIAYSNTANTAGMGAVVMPTLSGIPGQTGGAGSGDIAQYVLPGAMKIAAATIGFELLPTVAVKSNRVDQLYHDFPYDDVANPFTGDELATTFQLSGSAGASDDTALAAYLRTVMAANGVQEQRGSNSKPLFFKMGAAADLLSYDPTVRPTSVNHWVSFVGFGRITGKPMFRIFEQDNTTSSGGFTYAAALNTIDSPATGTATFFGTAATQYIIDYAGGANQKISTAAPTLSVASTNEDFVVGFTSDYKSTPKTRGTWDASQAAKIGPNTFVKTVEIGVRDIKASLRLSELDDYRIQYGIDIKQRTAARLASELSQAISREIVEKLKSACLTNRLTLPTVPYTLANWGTAILDPRVTDFSTPLIGAAMGGENTLSLARKLWTKIQQGSAYIQQDGRIGQAEWVVSNPRLVGAIRSIVNYVVAPLENSKLDTKEFYPMGVIDGIKIFVDPTMLFNDDTVYIGRVGKADEPGYKFFAYLLAQSVEIVSEATMGSTMYMYSRYAIADYGFFPEKQYMAIKVYDPSQSL